LSFKNSEDEKLRTLAAATLARTGALQAAALRDTTGRTYVAINVATKNFSLTALDAVFTVAMASQIDGIEAVVVMGEKPNAIGAISEYAPSAPIWFCAKDGEVTAL